MANLDKWNTPGSWTSQITTGLNSLTTGSAATSSAIDNSSAFDIYVDVSFQLGSISPSGTPYLELHLLPRLADGSTYSDRTASTLVATLAVTTGSSAKNGILNRVVIPPGFYELSVVNQTGATLAASGNTVSTRAYEENLNG